MRARIAGAAQKCEPCAAVAKKIKHLVVVGEAADDLGMQCGGWTIDWQGGSGKVTSGGTTILAAIRNTVSRDTEVVFSRGCGQRQQRRCRRRRGGRIALRRNERRQPGAPDLRHGRRADCQRQSRVACRS